MNKKILILVDSSSTINLEQAKKYEIEILPLSIYRSDGSTYIYESLKMSGNQFLEMGDEDYTFSTSCTPQGILEEVINDKLNKYDAIIALPISQRWSSQYDHLKALSLQEQYVNKLFVVNTLEYGYAIECLAIELRQMINEGIYTISDLVDYAENYHKFTICYFACKVLKGLVDSGRVPKIAAKLFKLAKIKPILRVEGENHLETIIKNFSEVINKIIKAIIKIYGGEFINKNIKKIAILTADNSSEYLQEVVTDLSKTFGIDKKDVEIRQAPNIFINIVGRGAIGVHVIANKQKVK